LLGDRCNEAGSNFDRAATLIRAKHLLGEFLETLADPSAVSSAVVFTVYGETYKKVMKTIKNS